MAKVNLGFDQEALLGVINAVKENPEAGKTVWKAETRWKEGFQSEAVIPTSGGGTHTVPMDEPKQLGGGSSAPNMVEMILGAYGCCLTTGIVAQAGLRGIELEGVDIQLEGDLDLQGFFGLADVPPGYSEIRCKVDIKAPGTSRAELEDLYAAVTATSPVGTMLTNPVNVKAELA